MKRRSKLFLIAALVLALSIPVFALAETAVRPLDGTGYQGGRNEAFASDVVDAQGNAYSLANGYGVNGDGTCFFLDENGAAQPLYTRMANGELTALQSFSGALCPYFDTENETRTTEQPRGNFMGGRGCRRWN